MKLSCNGVDQVQLMAQCGFMGRPSSALVGRNSVTGFRSRRVSSVQAVASTKDAAVVNRVEPENGTLADRLRLGSLVEDGMAYKERFIIRSYEVGVNKTATIETIANFMQEVGCDHAQGLGYTTDGFATTPTMRKLHLIWVSARMHIEVYKYPVWGDVIEMETWVQADGRAGTRRDFIFRDYATNEVIGRATSKWLMMNQDTRRLQKINDAIREEYLVSCPRELKLAIPEEDNNCFKKIPKLKDPAQNSKLRLVPRRADLDMNHHVNNVTYIAWLLESMPQEIIDTHELHSITLDYRRECQQNDIVDSLTSVEAFEDSEVDKQEYLQYLHLLRLSTNGDEINKGRSQWRKKAQR